jgi:hypothetical protein
MRLRVADLKYSMEELYFPLINNPKGRFDNFAYTTGLPMFDVILAEGIVDELIPYIQKNCKLWKDEDILPKSISELCRPKPKGDPFDGWSFYTIVPKTRMGLELKDTIHEFCIDFLEKDKFFKEIHYVVESGKYQDKPNLHIHFLCKFKEGTSKNFKRDFCKKWYFYFCDDYDINYEIKRPDGSTNTGWDRVPVNTADILRDKIVYMQNCEKGSHENFTDLGICKHIVF